MSKAGLTWMRTIVPLAMLSLMPFAMMLGNYVADQDGRRPTTGDVWFETYIDKTFAAERFHLPDDIEWVHVNRTGRRTKSVSAVVQFTPEQFDAYTATLEDPNVWTFPPFTYDKYNMEGTPEPGTFHWYPDDGAWINLDERLVLRWVNRNSYISDANDGKPRRQDVKNRRTMCMGVTLKRKKQRVASCHAFGPDHNPGFIIQGTLDYDDHRLFMHVGY